MISAKRLLETLPSEWPDSLLPEIRAHLGQRMVVVLDDDPTGTQTVADIPVLTEWSVASLCAELQRDQPAFYILTNSRSVPEQEAVALNVEIGRNLLQASQQTNRDFAVVSRSDSTLRGHFPAETDALATVLRQKFDSVLLILFFEEGGRLTIDDTHYVLEDDTLIPAGETPFAQDRTFGYRASNLHEWVAEKTGTAVATTSISIVDIRAGGADRVSAKLRQVTDGQVVIVNAVSMRDLEVFTLGLLRAEAAGKRFLYRTAASFVQVRTGLAPRPLLTADELGIPKRGGGLIVAGSYVPKTTRQIEALLAQTEITPIVVEVARLLDAGMRSAEIERIITTANSALANGQDVIVYTSRELLTDYQGRSGLEVGQIISQSLVTIVQSLSERPRYLVAKGGITSSDIATDALNVRRANIAGQILPGVPVWQTGTASRYPDLPLIVFPGNVGTDNALVTLLSKLHRQR